MEDPGSAANHDLFEQHNTACASLAISLRNPNATARCVASDYPQSLAQSEHVFDATEKEQVTHATMLCALRKGCLATPPPQF
eukprot:367516-Pelagomonas_calceolata.AAC.3